MKIRMAAAAAALALSAVAGAPNAAAQPTQTWEMPDFRGMNLAAAQAEFAGITEEGGPRLRYLNRSGPGEVINLTNWTVCAQSPSPGGTVRVKSTPIVAVNRPNQC